MQTLQLYSKFAHFFVGYTSQVSTLTSWLLTNLCLTYWILLFKNYF